MTKTHKHRTKVAEIHYFKPVRDSRNYESSNPAVTGKIRGLVGDKNCQNACDWPDCTLEKCVAKDF